MGEDLKLAAKLLKENKIKFDARINPATGKYVGQMYDKDEKRVFLSSVNEYKTKKIAKEEMKREAEKIIKQYNG